VARFMGLVLMVIGAQLVLGGVADSFGLAVNATRP
jgi:small neutral amino acid transporter SnatA (MarC family)